MSISQGRLAESIFTSECLRRNIQIFTPYCDDRGIDFITLKDKTYNRVQVKSTSKADRRYPNKPTYKFNLRSGAARSKIYKNDAFDFYAFLVIELNLWYIVPKATVKSKTTIRINPRSKTCNYFEYQNRFDLLF